MKRKVGLSTLVVALVLSTLLFAAPVQAASGAKGVPAKSVDLWLTVLHNSDAESKLVNLGGALSDFGGAARFKTLVDQLKWNATHGTRYMGQTGAKRAVLMVSSGDNFLAGPEFTASMTKGVPYYDTIAMDLIGYNAVCIGNHDFDFGPDVLADFISGFKLTKPPFLSANLDFSDEPSLEALVKSGRIAKSTIVNERGEKIGIIGAITPLLPSISSPRMVHVIADVAGAINGEVHKLMAKGVNKIILISHMQALAEDKALIAQLDDVDVVVAGGSDSLLANAGDLLIPGEAPAVGPYPLTGTLDMDGVSVPIVTVPGSYAYVGKLVVGFDKAGKVVAFGNDSGPVRVAGDALPDAVKPDPVMTKLVTNPVAAALAQYASHQLAVSEVPLDGLKADVRTKETNEGDLIADSLLWKGAQLAPLYGAPVPDVAIQNSGGIRNNSIIPAGPITELDTFSIAPFANFIAVLPNVSRDIFKAALENSVSAIVNIDGRFPQIAGFKFTYDFALTTGSRVREVELLDAAHTKIVTGGVVVPGPGLSISTNDFTARGGDFYPFAGLPFVVLGASYQQGLSDYLVTGLNGKITAAQYPVGGTGRITRLN